MTTSAHKKHRIARADVVIGPYGYNLCNCSINWDLVTWGFDKFFTGSVIP